MPESDSPPPFAIRIRSRSEPSEKKERLYRRTLELSALVATLADDLEVARFHLRDRLDRNATHLVVSCGRALGEPVPAERRRAYRDAKPFAHECASLLDIVGLRLRRVRRDLAVVDEAKSALADIIAALDHLASR